MLKKIREKIYKVLINSQKFTQTDNVYLAKFGSFLSLGNIISTGASLVLSMAFARFLPKEVYGNYRYLLSIMTIIGIFALPGMEDAIVQAVANRYEGCLKKAFKQRVRWAFLGSLACLIVGGYFFFRSNYILTISFAIAAVFFPLMESLGTYLAYLGGKKLFGIQVTYSTLTQIIASAGIIITIFFSKNLIILVSVYFLLNTLLRGLFFLITIKKFQPNQDCDNEFIKFGKNLTFLRVVHTIAGQLDRLLLFQFLGPIQLAIYSFANLPASEANLFLKNLRLLALPKMASRPHEEIKKTLIKKVIKATVLVIPFVALYIFLAPYIFKIFFPQYMDSVFYSQLIFLVIAFSPASVIALTFQAKMMKKELYNFSIISPLVSIVLTIILIIPYGVIGAIVAQLVSQAFTICFSLYLFKKS
jgi:O-antigen/teichoic acid export membrane protein